MTEEALTLAVRSRRVEDVAPYHARARVGEAFKKVCVEQGGEASRRRKSEPINRTKGCQITEQKCVKSPNSIDQHRVNMIYFLHGS